MDKFTTSITEKKKLFIYTGAGLALVLIIVVAWVAFTRPSDPDPVLPADPSVPPTSPGTTDDSVKQDFGEVEVGPTQLPAMDLSPQIATWKIDTLTPIPATTDSVEFARAFAAVWMAPNFVAYDKETFATWVFAHFVPNSSSARATNSAEVSIHDQMIRADDWDLLADRDGQTQAVQVLSVEEPEWIRTGGQAQAFITDATREGWTDLTLIEAYGLVYTQGLLDGTTPFAYADLRRDIYAITCDPYCGIADVLNNHLDRLGGQAHGKDLGDFDLAGSHG